jgi:hypothetical protein
VIPKITRGGNTRGLLLYLIGKGRREEHVDPHLVAGSAEAMLIAGGRVLEGGARDAAQLARFLDEPRETFGTQVRIAERNPDGKVVGSRDAHVWHTSLSLHPDEPALSDERWGQIAERVHRRDGVRRRGSAGAVSVAGGPPRRVAGRV